MRFALVRTCICFFANPGLVVPEVAENEEGLSTPLVDETLAHQVAELACGEIHGFCRKNLLAECTSSLHFFGSR